MEQFNLELISGEEGVNCLIIMSDLLRSGIEIVGYFIYYLRECVQFFGKIEFFFFEQLLEEEKKQ